MRFLAIVIWATGAYAVNAWVDVKFARGEISKTDKLGYDLHSLVATVFVVWAAIREMRP